MTHEIRRSFLDALVRNLAPARWALVLFVLALYWLGAPRMRLATWALAVAGVQVVTYLVHRLYLAAPPDHAHVERWSRRLVALSALASFTWGSALYAFIPGTIGVELITVMGVTAISVGALGLMAGQVPAYGAYLFFTAAWALALVRLGDALHVCMGLGVALFQVSMVFYARRMHETLVRSFMLAHENRELARQLAQQKHAAEIATRAKSRFLAAASHDLRQPVHALGLLVDVLCGQHLDAQQAATVERIQRSAQALEGLFDSLLDIGKLEAGSVVPRVVDVPVAALLRQTVAQYEPLANAKGLRLVVRPMNAVVRSDPLLLQRIVGNLVANAIHYSRRGGVLVGCRTRGAALLIEVWDTGIGIPAEEHAAVFDEFYQGAAARPLARGYGLGLGLSIVRQLCDLLGHAVELHSIVGRGTRVRIRLPRVAGAVQQAPGDGAEAAHVAAGARSILLVEDDDAVRFATASVLEAWGARVAAYASVQDARASLTEWRQAPEFIVTDRHLPDGDGLELVETLRDEFNALIPALIITGDLAPIPAEAMPQRAQVAHKPLAPAELRRAIDRLARPG